MQHAVVLFTQPSGFSSDPSGSDFSPGISGIHFGGVPTSVHTDKCFHLLNFKCLQNPSDWALFLRQRWGKHCFKSLLQREMGKQYAACWLSYTLVTGRRKTAQLLRAQLQLTQTAGDCNTTNFPRVYAKKPKIRKLMWSIENIISY